MTPIQIYEKLHSECRPDSTPIPDKLFEEKGSPKMFGLMAYLISDAFELMRETNGKSNWEVNCTCLCDKTKMGKKYMTKNTLRKELIACLTKNFIKDLKEDNGKISAKINAEYLFEFNQ